MTYEVRNWSRYQHYKHRKPPWIRLYRNLLDDRDFMALSGDASKLLALCWLLASEDDGKLPSADEIAWRIRMDAKRVRELIAELDHWIVASASTTLAPCKQDATTETESDNTETEKKDGADAPYAFVGKVIRLNQDDFDRWKQSFPLVELLPYLVSRDEFLADLPETDNRRKKWMVSTASDLRNKNAAARDKRKTQLSGSPKFKPEPTVNQKSAEERARQVERLLGRSTKGLTA